MRGMRPGPIVGLLYMSMILAGCGVATFTESGTAPAQPSASELARTVITPPQLALPAGLRGVRPTGGLAPEPVPVADGETAVDPSVFRIEPPVIRLGPPLPPPA